MKQTMAQRSVKNTEKKRLIKQTNNGKTFPKKKYQEMQEVEQQLLTNLIVLSV